MDPPVKNQLLTDEALNTLNGTTPVAEKMYAFNSSNDTVAYSVNIRPAFDAFVAGLPASQRFSGRCGDPDA